MVPSGSRPIVDGVGKVCGVFGDRPLDADFMEKVHDPAVEAMEEARANCSVSEEHQHHRRGSWTNLTAGDSMGGGQVCPGALVNDVINTAVLVTLLSFATGLLATWAPNLFDFYVDYMHIFYTHYPHLHRPFLNGIWCAVTFNLGPWTCTLGHRDYANLAFGWCVITALGNFDYRKGGHLILWDCKLIIEFPPGTTVLIPSAAIFHSNIPVSDDEHRYSFTQYTAGGIFRWIENGFQSSEAYLASLSKKEREEEEKMGKLWAEYGVGLLSTVSELEALY
ncbi:hypothetical protein B0H17DRAFT_1160245 [Mycena rosella]|uniref:Uncharacterized protein n=1 Tax=Mycena rosella TaxID=1033263 RepID=A0AAD7DDL7_MYCRO|nr:hypothetical protein B0H17DRAFT_1160245 [Mycena rosella]